MNEDISRSVIAILPDLGLEARSYSGRGMYGAECVGVDCEGMTSHQIVARIVLALCEQGPDGLDAAEHFTRDGAVASDSMGRGSIVYFPRLPWVEEDEEGEDPHAVAREASFERSPQS